MHTEWEATFWPIDPNIIRERLSAAGASLVYPERLMRRVNLYPPDAGYAEYAWVRIRDEGDRITLTLKENKKNERSDPSVERIEDIQELEIWDLNGVQVSIDTWPFLEPFIEIEGTSEEAVRAIAHTLSCDWNTARFCTADKLYAERYGVEARWVNRSIPRLTFDMENPFLKKDV